MTHSTIRIAICDDENSILQRIRKHVSDHMENEGREYTISCFSSGDELIALGTEIEMFDVIFLDINMNGTNGMETAQMIRSRSAKVAIAFVTAVYDYVFEGYKVDAIRFILKDERTMEAAIGECLDAVLKRIDNVILREFAFREGKIAINICSVLYIESNLHKLVFHVEKENGEKTFSMYKRLDEQEKELKEFGFVRVHQSYMINIRRIKRIEVDSVIMTNDDKIPIARSKKEAFNEALLVHEGDW